MWAELRCLLHCFSELVCCPRLLHRNKRGISGKEKQAREDDLPAGLQYPEGLVLLLCRVAASNWNMRNAHLKATYWEPGRIIFAPARVSKLQKSTWSPAEFNKANDIYAYVPSRQLILQRIKFRTLAYCTHERTQGTLDAYWLQVEQAHSCCGTAPRTHSVPQHNAAGRDEEVHTCTRE